MALTFSLPTILVYFNNKNSEQLDKPTISTLPAQGPVGLSKRHQIFCV
jgi:hypothetical protein